MGRDRSIPSNISLKAVLDGKRPLKDFIRQHDVPPENPDNARDFEAVLERMAKKKPASGQT